MLIGIISVIAWDLLQGRSLRLPPALEDADMTLPFSEDLARGIGISWDTYDASRMTDSATDLKLLLSHAPLVLIGIPLPLGAIDLSFGRALALHKILGSAGRPLSIMHWLAAS